MNSLDYSDLMQAKVSLFYQNVKTPELYVGDVLAIIEALDKRARSVAEETVGLSKTVKRKMFFQFWRRDYLREFLLAKSNMALAHLHHLREIREKMMQSTGVDDDMRPITLEQILKDHESASL